MHSSRIYVGSGSRSGLVPPIPVWYVEWIIRACTSRRTHPAAGVHIVVQVLLLGRRSLRTRARSGTLSATRKIHASHTSTYLRRTLSGTTTTTTTKTTAWTLHRSLGLGLEEELPARNLKGLLMVRVHVYWRGERELPGRRTCRASLFPKYDERYMVHGARCTVGMPVLFHSTTVSRALCIRVLHRDSPWQEKKTICMYD